jgi:hypothetical protein
MKWSPFFRAKRDALKMIRKMLKKRAEIQKRKIVSDDYIRQMLTPIASKEMVRQKLIQLIRG